MANNRLQIYCKKCKAMLPFAKYYPYGWYLNDPEANGRMLNDFMIEHEKCFTEEEAGAFGVDMFAFRTEQEKDGLLSDYRRPFKVTPIIN